MELKRKQSAGDQSDREQVPASREAEDGDADARNKERVRLAKLGPCELQIGRDEKSCCPYFAHGISLYPRNTLVVDRKASSCLTDAQWEIARRNLEAGLVIGFNADSEEAIDFACELGRRAGMRLDADYDEDNSFAFFAKAHDGEAATSGLDAEPQPAESADASGRTRSELIERLAGFAMRLSDDKIAMLRDLAASLARADRGDPDVQPAEVAIF